ncbi:MAG: dienelactone hydrolase family protein [Acidimicrobiales bacterium]
MTDSADSATPRPHAGTSAGSAFYVEPKGGQGPGVLVLTSWWGLTDGARSFCRRLADHGYVVLCPDLMEGETPANEAEGEAILATLAPDQLSALVLSSAQSLRAYTADQTKPIGVVGFSMGASMALWLSARLPDSVAAVSAFYGTQSIDFDDAKAVYQGHFGTADHLVSEEDRVVTESFLRLGGNDTEFFVYEGAGQWFFEDTANYDEAHASLAWDRLIAFLDAQLSKTAESIGSTMSQCLLDRCTFRSSPLECRRRSRVARFEVVHRQSRTAGCRYQSTDRAVRQHDVRAVDAADAAADDSSAIDAVLDEYNRVGRDFEILEAYVYATVDRQSS